PHEVHDDDLAGNLVREFLFHAHGVSREQKRTRVAEAERAAAAEWLEAYGVEKAKWMVERCVKMQKEQHRPKILVFRGLQLYESAAAGASDHHVTEETNRRERELSAELDAYWKVYRSRLVRLFDARAGAEELARLEAELRDLVKRERPDAPEVVVKAFVQARL